MSDENVIPLARAGVPIAADVAKLAADFPEWEVGVDWVTSNSGTDYRFLWARRERVMLTAWDESQLARMIRRRS